MVGDEEFLDDLDSGESENDHEVDIEASELAEKEALAQAQKNLLARKRIDELMERKRLKELLDDEDDW